MIGVGCGIGLFSPKLPLNDAMAICGTLLTACLMIVQYIQLERGVASADESLLHAWDDPEELPVEWPQQCGRGAAKHNVLTRLLHALVRTSIEVFFGKVPPMHQGLTGGIAEDIVHAPIGSPFNGVADLRIGRPIEWF